MVMEVFKLVKKDILLLKLLWDLKIYHYYDISNICLVEVLKCEQVLKLALKLVAERKLFVKVRPEHKEGSSLRSELLLLF